MAKQQTGRLATVVAALTVLAAPATASAERIRVTGGAALSAGAGGAGACLLSDSGTEGIPCQYLAGIELTFRPTAASPVRALGGARAALYTNDYPGDSSHDRAYYSTSGRELWLGAAWEVHAPRPALAIEVVTAVGRGFGQTEEWEYPNVGAPLAETDNDYWFSDLGAQLTYASPRRWFASARLASTVVRFAPEGELIHDLGWQVTTLLPRGELGVGVYF